MNENKEYDPRKEVRDSMDKYRDAAVADAMRDGVLEGDALVKEVLDNLFNNMLDSANTNHKLFQLIGVIPEYKSPS